MRKTRSRHPGLTTVQVTAGLVKAHVIKAKLQQAGIPVLLDYESAGPVIGITMNGLGAVSILVPDERVEEARALIEGR